MCQSFIKPIKPMNLTQCFFVLGFVCFFRLKEAQLSVKRITADKKVETKRINPNSLVSQG